MTWLLLGIALAKPLPDLPDAPTSPVPAEDPLALLEASAGSDTPTIRADALVRLIEADPASDGGPYAQRCLYDPEGWVQRACADVLLGRLPMSRDALVAFAVRQDSIADPYARAHVAIALRSDPAGLRAGFAWAAEPDPFRKTALAAGAATLGDSDALAMLRERLAKGDVGLEPAFLADLTASGLDLAGAFDAGSAWVDDEIAVEWAAADLVAGGSTGRPVLDAALGADPWAAMGVVDALVPMRGATADAWLRKSAKVKDPGVRAYAKAALAARGAGSPSAFKKALRSEDREVRVLAMQLAAPTADRALVDLGLADPDPAVRIAALHAAPRVGIPDDDPRIQTARTDPSADVRIAAAGAILR